MNSPRAVQAGLGLVVAGFFAGVHVALARTKSTPEKKPGVTAFAAAACLAGLGLLAFGMSRR